MTDRKPAGNAPATGAATQRDEVKEALRAKALKANLRRRKAPMAPDEGAI